MLSYRMMRSELTGSKEALGKFQFVTISGRVEFEDVGRVIKIAHYYSRAVKAGINLALKGVPLNDAVKELYRIIPYAFYAETAYKQALALIKNGGNKIEIRRRWIACKGSKADRGNRGIKFHVLEDHVEVKVKDPWGRWIVGRAYFGRKYLPLLRELEELAGKGEEGYGAVISFKEKPMIHLQIPLWLYLKHFSVKKPIGYGLIAGFDLNSDRLNVVVIDRDGRIVTTRTYWYPEVTRPGFPREKGKALRLNALSNALKFLSRIGVDYVVFEDLFLVKGRRRFTKSKSGNRRISRFAKRQLLTHGVIKSLRLGFNVILANPKGTTNSKEHEKVMKERGFDRHTASAYLIALRGLETNSIKGVRSN